MHKIAVATKYNCPGAIMLHQDLQRQIADQNQGVTADSLVSRDPTSSAELQLTDVRAYALAAGHLACLDSGRCIGAATRA